MLPDSWIKVQLGEILINYQNGFAFSASEYVEEGVPIISMANISLEGKFQYDAKTSKRWDEKYKDELEDFIVRKGDVIIAMTDVTPTKNLIGRMAEVTAEEIFLLNQRVGLLKIDDKKAFPKFISYVGNSGDWIKYCRSVATQGAQANISTKDIRKGIIPLPPINEQQKIAEILSIVDEKIEVIEEKISKTLVLKKGLMQQLLSKGIDHQTYIESAVGKIPETWKCRQIGEIAKVIRGASPRPKGDPLFYGGEVPRLMVQDVTRDGKYVTPSIDFLTSEGAKKSRPMVAGSLVMVCSGEVGVPAILAVDACIHDGFLGFTEINKDCDLEFLYYSFDSLRQSFHSSATHGGVFTNLTTGIVKDFLIALPPKQEQIRIAKILSEVDLRIKVLNAKKELTIRLKQGLLKYLLFGKIRVTPLLQKESIP